MGDKDRVPGQHSKNSEDPLEKALAEFNEALFSGKQLDPDEFCKNHPECGDELRERIDDLLFVVGTFPDEGGGRKNNTAGKTLGDFRIIRQIGKGGMGIVYEAEQISIVLTTGK